jgi:hypothetical protein
VFAMKLVLGALVTAAAVGTAGAQTTERPLFGQFERGYRPAIVASVTTTSTAPGTDIDGARALTGPRIPFPAAPPNGVVVDRRAPVDGACALVGQCALLSPRD